jgi:hypothetical protein
VWRTHSTEFQESALVIKRSLIAAAIVSGLAAGPVVLGGSAQADDLPCQGVANGYVAADQPGGSVPVVNSNNQIIGWAADGDPVCGEQNGNGWEGIYDFNTTQGGFIPDRNFVFSV